VKGIRRRCLVTTRQGKRFAEAHSDIDARHAPAAAVAAERPIAYPPAQAERVPAEPTAGSRFRHGLDPHLHAGSDRFPDGFAGLVPQRAPADAEHRRAWATTHGPGCIGCHLRTAMPSENSVSPAPRVYLRGNWPISRAGARRAGGGQWRGSPRR